MTTDRLTQQIQEALEVAAKKNSYTAGVMHLINVHEWDRADAELEFYEAVPKRAYKALYEGFKPKEGDEVQFMGVRALAWRPEWGVPTMAFVEYNEEEGDSEQEDKSEQSEIDRLKEGILCVIDEDAMSDESDYQWLSRMKEMLANLLESEV